MRALFAALLIAGSIAGCAAYAALPTAPPEAPLVRDEPVQCPDGSLLYIHAHVNPATQAVAIIVGPATAAHTHGNPFLVVRVDDGVAVFYLLTDSGIKTFSAADWAARYGDTSVGSACRARIEKQV